MKTALVILDMLNLFDFPEGKLLAKQSVKIAKAIKSLKDQAYKKKVPVIYVNDNLNQWTSDWHKIHQQCLRAGKESAQIAELLKPQARDYIVLKAKHSGFFRTNLEELLHHLKVKRLILTGIAGNICVMFTAHDAHMRDFEVIIPKDAIASNTAQENKYALKQLGVAMGFKTPLSQNLRLST